MIMVTKGIFRDVCIETSYRFMELRTQMATLDKKPISPSGVM